MTTISGLISNRRWDRSTPEKMTPLVLPGALNIPWFIPSMARSDSAPTPGWLPWLDILFLMKYVHRSAQVDAPGCVNAAGKLGRK